MSRGKKYSDDIKELAYALYAVNGSKQETARQIKEKTGVTVAANTITDWINKKPPDGFDELREEKKRGFIENANAIIDKGMQIMDRRFTRALEQEEEIDELIGMVSKTDDMSDKQKDSITRKLSALQLHDIKALTTAIGTLYDKRALAQGESTDNTKIEFKLPKGVDEYAE